MSKVNVTVRLEEDVVAFLDKLAQHEERNRSFLIMKAVRQYVELQKRQAIEMEGTKGALDSLPIDQTLSRANV